MVSAQFIARAQAKRRRPKKVQKVEEPENNDLIDTQVPEETDCTAADDNFYVGAVVNERYIVLRFIDRGAYARVWHAYDTKESRTVALKTWIIPKKRERYDEGANEVKLLRKLRGCEGCVFSYEDFKLANGARGAAIPFAGALCIDQLDARNAERAWRSCALALKRAHAAGVAHSDLKPRNILFHTDYSLNDHAGKWFTEHIVDKAAPRESLVTLSKAFMDQRDHLPGPPDDDPVHLDKCMIIDFRGTQGSVAPGWQYCAPEVLLEGAKGFDQDWWAMACVGLFWCNGYHPFKPTREVSREIDIEREILARIIERLQCKPPKSMWENYANHFDDRGRVKKIKVTKRPDEPLMENTTTNMTTWIRGQLHWDVKRRVVPDLVEYTHEDDSDSEVHGTVVDGVTTVILSAQKNHGDDNDNDNDDNDNDDNDE